ncbi:MAG: 30S ribosomal protein S12 methylthiotransferase RimO [Bacteroidetes bacterium]|nr:30S ribosomal protein S12 methylthiotransferase RimO [Bacteroidota bacterium]
MKTKGKKKNLVNVITLGCAKNLVDSEVMMGQLNANNITVSHQSNNSADIIIINTCGFIENAKQESIDTILRYADYKDSGGIEKLYVTGCLSQRYRDELQLEIPQVDAWFGTMELPLLLKKFKADYKHDLVGERILTTDAHYAYLKISEGCDRPCSFCAIPLMRGKHVSKPIETIVLEAKTLAGKGVKEIILIAQDSTFYGLDLYGKRNLAILLERLTEVDGIEWIRLHYAFPTGFPLDILDTMAYHPKICNYLDIPLQHGSNKMLRLMRRGITREKTERLIATLRDKIPDIAIRTTMIIGHPGETEQDFQEMTDFILNTKFDRLGVFTYSHEENTHAYQMKDDVPESVKLERSNIVMEIQERISNQLNQQKVGKTLKVLIDRKEGAYFVGRTEYDSPEVDNEVLIEASKGYLRIGDYCNILITSAEDFDLYGAPA